MIDIIQLPEDYTTWLAELKTRIHSVQQRASLSVNRELVSCTGKLSKIFWRGKTVRVGDLKSSNGWHRIYVTLSLR
jgi:hypothetical protein